MQELLALVAPKGADMLLKGLNDRVYVPPRANTGWQQLGKVNQELRFAPKITPEDRHINWNSWSADRILRTSRVIGPLWNIAKNLNPGKSDNKRIIWTGGFSKFSGYFDPFSRPSRPAFIGLGSRSISQPVFLKTCDGHVLAVDNIKIEGAREMSSWDAFQKVEMINIPSGSDGLPQDFAQLQVGLE